MSQYQIIALYRFTLLENFEKMRKPLLAVMLENEVRGTLLLAREGINGTVAGTPAGIRNLLAYLRSDSRLKDLTYKVSYHEETPFYRSRVKLKREIVTMGVEGIDPRRSVGAYVKPEDWNALISDPEVTLIDTRNLYETRIGSFQGAVIPPIETFREFPDYVMANFTAEKHKKVAMFCTGGIRCEKSTAYLKALGFEEVYHLEGGILNYLEKIPEEESLWRGDCFVFDNRVSVDHSLQKGAYEQCFACRNPLSPQDMESEKYIPGVSCPYCAERSTEKQKQRFRERWRQLGFFASAERSISARTPRRFRMNIA